MQSQIYLAHKYSRRKSDFPLSRLIVFLFYVFFWISILFPVTVRLVFFRVLVCPVTVIICLFILFSFARALSAVKVSICTCFGVFSKFTFLITCY